jgi:hypothetical protein
MLEMLPGAFIRIEIGGIRGQLLQVNVSATTVAQKSLTC